MSVCIKRHLSFTESHLQQMSDRNHYVNYRDPHVNLPETIPYTQA
jgi:hypothetical protein